MEKLIMVKYGELSTKKANINLFLKQLKVNVEKALVGLNVEIKFDKGRMFITLNDDNFDEVSNKLKNVFGIHEYNVAYKLDTRESDEIGSAILELVKEMEFNTFKGTYNFKLKRDDTAEHTLDIEASLAEGEIKIYIGIDGEKELLRTVKGGESYDETITLDDKYDNEKTIYIILESTGKCEDGDFEFEYNWSKRCRVDFSDSNSELLACEFGGDRCFGIAGNMDFLFVCTYEENGEYPELLVYKKR